jgi:hypothetical protein
MVAEWISSSNKMLRNPFFGQPPAGVIPTTDQSYQHRHSKLEMANRAPSHRGLRSARPNSQTLTLVVHSQGAPTLGTDRVSSPSSLQISELLALPAR